MEPISINDVKNAVKTHGIQMWILRSCSMCGTPLTYAFHGECVTYDSSCGCTSYNEPPDQRDWSDLVEIFNRQTPEVRKRMWDEFTASGVA